MNPKITQGLIPSIMIIIGLIIGEGINLKDKQKFFAMYLAIGALIAILSLQLIPMMHKTSSRKEKIITIISVIITLIFLYILNKKSEKKKIKNKSTNENKSILIKQDIIGLEIIFPLIIGLFFDGFIIGIQDDSLNMRTGIILAFALSIDNFLIGLGIGSTLNKKILLILYCFVMGIATIGGTVIGISAFKKFKNSIYIHCLISFGVISLMWETYQELLPETKEPDDIYNLIGLYFGFIVVFISNWLI
jgi:zinc transporter ZupT